MTLQTLATVVGIVGGLIGVATAIILVLRYFSQTSIKFTDLSKQLEALRHQNESLQATLRIAPEGRSTRAFERLEGLSAEAARALSASYHSISIADPPRVATYLKIIHSTDPAAAKIVGRRFPANQGFSGGVFMRQIAEKTGQLGKDPRHFDKVDKAAKTDSGSAAALALPLPLKDQGWCRGVAMFFKTQGDHFSDADLLVAERWALPLSKLVDLLELDEEEDIPSIARGHLSSVTVMFTDIAGFSQIASRLRTQTIVELLNEYYSRLLPVALRNRGELCEYIGDGMYIVFRSEGTLPPADSAVLASIGMAKEYEAVLNSWSNYEQPVSETNVHGIGIATGEVYGGLLGVPEIRREKLVGPPVNLAAHLCAEAKRLGGGVLICPQTRSLLHGVPCELAETRTERGLAFRVVLPA